MIDGEGLGFARRVTVNDNVEGLFRPRRSFSPYERAGTHLCAKLGADGSNEGAIVMDNADSPLNPRTIVPSPHDLGQAAAL